MDPWTELRESGARSQLRRTTMLPNLLRLTSSTALCFAVFVAPAPRLTAQAPVLPSPEQQSHESPSHGHSHSENNASTTELLTIEHVLSLPQNQNAIDTGAFLDRVKASSGDGDLSFEVSVTSKQLPKKVFEENPSPRSARSSTAHMVALPSTIAWAKAKSTGSCKAQAQCASIPTGRRSNCSPPTRRW